MKLKRKYEKKIARLVPEIPSAPVDLSKVKRSIHLAPIEERRDDVEAILLYVVWFHSSLESNSTKSYGSELVASSIPVTTLNLEQYLPVDLAAKARSVEGMIPIKNLAQMISYCRRFILFLESSAKIPPSLNSLVRMNPKNLLSFREHCEEQKKKKAEKKLDDGVWTYKNSNHFRLNEVIWARKCFQCGCQVVDLPLEGKIAIEKEFMTMVSILYLLSFFLSFFLSLQLDLILN